MNRILNDGIWREISRLAKMASERRAAIAYVTKDALGLKKGDTLIIDASDTAIKAGQTSVKILSNLLRRGVKLFSLPGLHAKVVSLGETAVIGSANMSESSAGGLIEAAIATDNPSAVAGVKAFIHRACERGSPLSVEEIRRLKRIKVTARPAALRRHAARGAIETGSNTWLLGLYELKPKSFLEDQAAAEQEQPKAETLRNLKTSSVEWVRWSARGTVRDKLRPGDSIIELWSPLGSKKPTKVYRHLTVLSRKERKTCSLFFIENPERSERDSMSSSRFRKLLKHIGFHHAVGRNTARRLNEDVADLIHMNWKRFAQNDKT